MKALLGAPSTVLLLFPKLILYTIHKGNISLICKIKKPPFQMISTQYRTTSSRRRSERRTIKANGQPSGLTATVFINKCNWVNLDFINKKKNHKMQNSFNYLSSNVWASLKPSRYFSLVKAWEYFSLVKAWDRMFFQTHRYTNTLSLKWQNCGLKFPIFC